MVTGSGPAFALQVKMRSGFVTRIYVTRMMHGLRMGRRHLILSALLLVPNPKWHVVAVSSCG
jgi:hypothetical protein